MVLCAVHGYDGGPRPAAREARYARVRQSAESLRRLSHRAALGHAPRLYEAGVCSAHGGTGERAASRCHPLHRRLAEHAPTGVGASCAHVGSSASGRRYLLRAWQSRLRRLCEDCHGGAEAQYGAYDTFVRGLAQLGLAAQRASHLASWSRLDSDSRNGERRSSAVPLQSRLSQGTARHIAQIVRHYDAARPVGMAPSHTATMHSAANAERTHPRRTAVALRLATHKSCQQRGCRTV